MSNESNNKNAKKRKQTSSGRSKSDVGFKSAIFHSFGSTDVSNLYDEDDLNPNERLACIKRKLRLTQCEGVEANAMQQKVIDLIFNGVPVEYPFVDPRPGSIPLDVLCAKFESGFLQAAPGIGKTATYLLYLLRDFTTMFETLESTGTKKYKDPRETYFDVENFYDNDKIPIQTAIFASFSKAATERFKKCFKLNITRAIFREVIDRLGEAGGTLPVLLQGRWKYKTKKKIQYLENCIAHGWVVQNNKRVDLRDILQKCLHKDLLVCKADWASWIDDGNEVATMFHIVKSHIAFDGWNAWSEANVTLRPLITIEKPSTIANARVSGEVHYLLAAALVVDECHAGTGLNSSSNNVSQWKQALRLLKSRSLCVWECSATVGIYPTFLCENYFRNILAGTDPYGCRPTAPPGGRLKRLMLTYSASRRKGKHDGWTDIYQDFKTIEQYYKDWTNDESIYVQVMLFFAKQQDIVSFRDYVQTIYHGMSTGMSERPLHRLIDKLWISTKTSPHKDDSCMEFVNGKWESIPQAEQEDKFDRGGTLRREDGLRCIRIQAGLYMDSESSDFPNVRYVGIHKSVNQLERIIQMIGRAREHKVGLSSDSTIVIAVVPEAYVIGSVLTATHVQGIRVHNFEEHTRRTDQVKCDDCDSVHHMDVECNCAMQWPDNLQDETGHCYELIDLENEETVVDHTTKQNDDGRSTPESPVRRSRYAKERAIKTVSRHFGKDGQEHGYVVLPYSDNSNSDSGDDDDDDDADAGEEMDGLPHVAERDAQIALINLHEKRKQDFRQNNRRKKSRKQVDSESEYEPENDEGGEEEDTLTNLENATLARVTRQQSLRSRNPGITMIIDDNVDLRGLLRTTGNVLIDVNKNGSFIPILGDSSKVFTMDVRCSTHMIFECISFFTDPRDVSVPMQGQGLEVERVNVLQQSGEGLATIKGNANGKKTIYLDVSKYKALKERKGNIVVYTLVRKRPKCTGCLSCKIRSLYYKDDEVKAKKNCIWEEDGTLKLRWCGKEAIVEKTSKIGKAFAEQKKTMAHLYNPASRYNFALMSEVQHTFLSLDTMSFIGTQCGYWLKWKHHRRISYFLPIKDIMDRAKDGVEARGTSLLDPGAVFGPDGDNVRCMERAREDATLLDTFSFNEGEGRPPLGPRLSRLHGITDQSRVQETELSRGMRTQTIPRIADKVNDDGSYQRGEKKRVDNQYRKEQETISLLNEYYNTPFGERAERHLCGEYCPHTNVTGNSPLFCRLANLHRKEDGDMPWVMKEPQSKHHAILQVRRKYRIDESVQIVPKFLEEVDSWFKRWLRQGRYNEEEFVPYLVDSRDCLDLQHLPKDTLSFRDCYDLSRGDFLEDTHFEAWVKILNRHFGGANVYCFSPQFSNSKGVEKSSLQSWYEKDTFKSKEYPENVFDNDRLVFPLCLTKKNHWITVWYEIAGMDQHPTVFIANSGTGSLLEEKDLLFLLDCLEVNTLHWKGDGFQRWDLKVKYLQPFHIPKQPNGYDCGVYSCGFMLGLCKGKSLKNVTWQDSESSKVRKRLLEALLTGRI